MLLYVKGVATRQLICKSLKASQYLIVKFVTVRFSVTESGTDTLVHYPWNTLGTCIKSDSQSGVGFMKLRGTKLIVVYLLCDEIIVSFTPIAEITLHLLV